MATTGFWPVKGRLKDVIKYAENPDKTIERKHLDDDLAAALSYVENSDKTDQTMYVSGINCPKKRAYEQMMTTKRRYGKLGGNVAYHGYQSFQAGEVTPEEAHRIGIETAKRMWGDDYEIVVTTHLNTSNLHNHIVVNSVSFRTGRKFENHISDHYKLREISDEVCREYGKSVLENAPFYSGDKAYWIRKSGQLPHKDMLRKDVDEALANTCNPVDFEVYLRSLGYKFVRNFKYEHPSVVAPDWQKPVRISSLGKNYSRQAILNRLSTQHEDRYFMDFYTPRPVVRRTPLILVIRDYEKEHTPDLITSLFELIIAIAKICTGSNIQKADYRPLSPDLRAEIINLDRTLEEYHFLCDQFINCGQDFVECKAEIVGKIESFEAERQHIRNQIRRAKTPEEDYSLKEQCREITKKLTPLRKQLKKAIREADTAIENLWRGIEQGQSVPMLTERLNKRQAEKEALEEQLAIEENKRICLSEAQILAFLDFVCDMPLDDVNKRRAIINILVHSVYLYDDHFTLIINASKKPMDIENIPLEEIEEAFSSDKICMEQCSTMTSSAPPRILGVSLGYSLFSHGEFCVILLERKIGMYGDVGLNEVKRIDINHYFIEKGTGEPLILLHGNGENCGYFQGQIDAFSKLYHVYALDTRGHGKTPRGDKPFTIRQFADDLLGFMDEHQIEKAHLLGFSDGGNIAMIFAIQFPDRVNRLILNGANLNPKGVKRSTQIPIEIGYKIAKKFAGKSDSARLNAETLGLMVNDPNVEPEELAKIKTKTLVIAGTKDMIKEEHTRLIASSIPDSVLVFLNGDHFIASKHPEEFNQAILQFLRS